MPAEERRQLKFTGPTDTQGELLILLHAEARKRGLDEKYPKYVSELFRKSLIVPSLKHPAEIMVAIEKMIKRGNTKEHEVWGKIHTIVGQSLTNDRRYWNAGKVWPNNMKTVRRAFPNGK